MSFATRVAGSPNPHQQEYYYTGKNINATSGSRTANTTPLQIGEVLAIDPYGHDLGKGYDVAVPTASFLSQNLVVVTAIKTNTNGDSASLGGTIMAVPLAKACADGIQVYVNGSVTAATSLLIPVDGQRYLAASTGIGSAEAIFSFKAKAMEGNSSGTALKWVQPL